MGLRCAEGNEGGAQALTAGGGELGPQGKPSGPGEGQLEAGKKQDSGSEPNGGQKASFRVWGRSWEDSRQDPRTSLYPSSTFWSFCFVFCFC